MLYLREHKTVKGLSIPKLVEMTGLGRRTLQDIEKRRDCLVSNAEKIAAAMGLTLDELCSPPQETDKTE